MLMVAEMTGSIDLLGPALVAVTIAWFIVGRSDDSIYRSQLRTRDDSPASRLRFGLPLLPTLRVSDVASPPRVTFQDRTPAAEALRVLHEAALPGAPVVDARGSYLGTVGTERLEEVATSGPRPGSATPSTPRRRPCPRLPPSTSVWRPWSKQWGLVPVTSGDRRVVSPLRRGPPRRLSQALDAYTGYVYNVSSHALAVEERVGRGAPVAGHQVRDAGLPPGCVVVTVQHKGVLSYATGSTEIGQGDTLSVLVAAEQVGGCGARAWGRRAGRARGKAAARLGQRSSSSR